MRRHLIILAFSIVGKREVMTARKTSGTATGSWGVASWDISDPATSKTESVVAMWSAPFNFDHHSNWLAVGVYSPPPSVENLR